MLNVDRGRGREVEGTAVCVGREGSDQGDSVFVIEVSVLSCDSLVGEGGAFRARTRWGWRSIDCWHGSCGGVLWAR